MRRTDNDTPVDARTLPSAAPALTALPAPAPTAPAPTALTATLAGLLGVVAFSLTVPVTRVAAPELGGLLVGAGRGVIAGLLAALVLAARGERLPRAHLRGLGVVAVGVVVGFPLCSALALERVSAMHGVVVVGLTPLATAVVAALRGDERQGAGFWAVTALGGAVVAAYAWARGARALEGADALLLLACALVGAGYAEGAVLTRALGGWRVIAWASVLALPLSLILVSVGVTLHPPHATPSAVLALAWLGAVSSFLAFFAWYHGLAHGGVGRVGALQLLQPILGVSWAALFLGEPLTVLELGAIVAIVPCVVLARAFAPRRVTA